MVAPEDEVYWRLLGGMRERRRGAKSPVVVCNDITSIQEEDA